MGIITKLENIKNLDYVGGCSDIQIEEAEQRLNLAFPKEYKQYLEHFGCVNFKNVYLTGLNVTGAFNVVEVTLSERKDNKYFPEKVFIIDIGLGTNNKIISNEKGNCFVIRNDEITKLYKNMYDYIDSLY